MRLQKEGSMDDVWYFKHCPQCGNYLKKLDPQESGMCCCCGWKEYIVGYYCEFRRRYCGEEDITSPVAEKVYSTTAS